jgi:hypothetical protein
LVRGKYENVWQKMLLEEAEEKERAAADAEGRRMLEDYERMLQGAARDRQGNAERKLGYDVGALPNFGGVTQPPPRLGYDFDLDDPLAGPGGYRVDDIVVNGRRGGVTPRSEQYPARTVLAQCDGRIMPGMTGWQNPQHHSGEHGGMGWRTWVQCADGSGRIGYGHMDPGTTLREGTHIKTGQPIGRYADPTNGHTDGGPHVHVQQFDPRERLIQPTVGSPLARPSHMTGAFRARSGVHSGPKYKKSGHQGEDWSDK